VKPGSTEALKVAGLLASGLDDNDDCGDLLGGLKCGGGDLTCVFDGR
jgi:hypothetical protein